MGYSGTLRRRAEQESTQSHFQRPELQGLQIMLQISPATRPQLQFSYRF